MYGGVAKTYVTWQFKGEPFKDKYWYIIAINPKPGAEKKVRWYTDKEHHEMFVAAGGKVDTESFAVFADFSYDLTDQLSLSVGGRWTQDKKSVDQLRQNYLGVKSPFFGNSNYPMDIEGLSVGRAITTGFATGRYVAGL